MASYVIAGHGGRSRNGSWRCGCARLSLSLSLSLSGSNRFDRVRVCSGGSTVQYRQTIGDSLLGTGLFFLCILLELVVMGGNGGSRYRLVDLHRRYYVLSGGSGVGLRRTAGR